MYVNLSIIFFFLTCTIFALHMFESETVLWTKSFLVFFITLIIHIK